MCETYEYWILLLLVALPFGSLTWLVVAYLISMAIIEIKERLQDD